MTALPLRGDGDPLESLTTGLHLYSGIEPDREDLTGPALSDLNPMRREFVLHYCLGLDGIRGVAYRSYLASGYNAKSNDVASAAAYQLLQDPKVLSAIAEVRLEIDSSARAKMRSWSVMAVKAQRLLEGYLDTLADSPGRSQDVVLSANGLVAIKEVLDRSIGKPTQPISHDIGDKLDSLIKRLASQGSPVPSHALPSGASVSTHRSAPEAALLLPGTSPGVTSDG